MGFFVVRASGDNAEVGDLLQIVDAQFLANGVAQCSQDVVRLGHGRVV
jgi:hypothetical protein